MFATVKIYYQNYTSNKNKRFALSPEKLYQVENFADYLANFTYITVDKFQLPKFDLKMSLKFNMPQTYDVPTKKEKPVYVSFQVYDDTTSEGLPVYYFIENYNWRSQNCLALDLLCDVLNTFQRMYDFKPETTVLREHRDRFTFANLVVNNEEITHLETNTYYYINTNVFPTTPDTTILTFPDDTLYLVYLSSLNPIVEDPTASYGCVKRMSQRLDDGQVVIDVTFMDGTTDTLEQFQINEYFWKITNEIDVLTSYIFRNKYGIDGLVEERIIRNIDRISENINPVLLANKDNYIFTDKNKNLTYMDHWYLVYRQEASEDENKPLACYLVPENAMAGPDVEGIDAWDRTDSQLIKIIELPYLPVTMLDTNPIRPEKFVKVNSPYKAWKLNDLNTSFSANVPIAPDLATYESVFQLIGKDMTDDLSQYADGDPHEINPEFECKMFHSEFYIPKYFYDSFSLPIILENVDVVKVAERCSYYSTYEPKIKIYTTNTMNSRFAFEIVDYEEKYRENDYPKFLVVARNNEIPLYNSAYLNYIRTGYNYDIKNKNASNALTWLGVGGQLVGTIATTAVAVASGGIAVPMAVGMGVSTFMGFANAINSTVKNERNIQERLDQLKHQSLGVIGSDDIDLLRRYNVNKLMFNTYEPSEELKQLIIKLFYFTGYATQRIGIPNTNTRLFFNYIKCEPVLIYHSGPSVLPYAFNNVFIEREFREELEKIMRTGYTIFHYKSTYGTDLYQHVENIETSIYNYFQLRNTED